MSSRREVLIRILTLLQKKTSIKPKNLTWKCLKRHYFTNSFRRKNTNAESPWNNIDAHDDWMAAGKSDLLKTYGLKCLNNKGLN